MLRRHPKKTMESGHTLKFIFSGTAIPVLERIDFTQIGQTESNFIDRHHRMFPLRWTKVTQALTLVFLEYVCWAKGGRKEVCFFTGKNKGSLAASLGDAIYKDVDEEFIHALFTYVGSKEKSFSFPSRFMIVSRNLFALNRP